MQQKPHYVQEGGSWYKFASRDSYREFDLPLNLYVGPERDNVGRVTGEKQRPADAHINALRAGEVLSCIYGPGVLSLCTRYNGQQAASFKPRGGMRRVIWLESAGIIAAYEEAEEAFKIKTSVTERAS